MTNDMEAMKCPAG